MFAVVHNLQWHHHVSSLHLTPPHSPPAAPRVIEQLRAAPRLRRLVYIACKPDHRRTSANLAALCRPPDAGDRSEMVPFRLARATPVDLFPHTDHLELVLTFER